MVIAFLKEISGVALMNSKPLASDTHLESNLTSMYKRRRVFCVHLTAAAAAKLLQSCPTLCDPIDGNPLGSSVPGILQARTLE